MKRWLSILGSILISASALSVGEDDLEGLPPTKRLCQRACPTSASTKASSLAALVRRQPLLRRLEQELFQCAQLQRNARRTDFPEPYLEWLNELVDALVLDSPSGVGLVRLPLASPFFRWDTEGPWRQVENDEFIIREHILDEMMEDSRLFLSQKRRTKLADLNQWSLDLSNLRIDISFYPLVQRR